MLKKPKQAPKRKKSKENACYLALREFGVLINGRREDILSVKDWTKVKKKSRTKETFGEWKTRVFKKDVPIKVYKPYQPSEDELMSALEKKCGGKHIQNIFNKFENSKERKFSKFPKETLNLLVDDLSDILQPEVKRFFDDFTKEQDDKIVIEDLLRELIKAYNKGASIWGKSKGSG